jgi:hypothetical protein
MNRITIIAAALVALARPAMAASSDEIRHYRTAFGHRLVCISNRWATLRTRSPAWRPISKRIRILTARGSAD